MGDTTPFEMCELARQWRSEDGWTATRVHVAAGAATRAGTLEKVSPVNAWIMVDGEKIPTGSITAMERL